MPKKLTNNEFIAKARIKHNNKYEYSNAKYINSHTPIIIICPIHGSFLQIPNNHLQGQGCPKCAKEKRVKTLLSCADKFINKAKKIHLNKNYDYSKVLYINSQTSVAIICPIHGKFWQTPNNHLSGKGCPKCAKEGKKKSTKTFIAEAKIVHKDTKYNYSETIYINNKTPVKIICQEHGAFWQKPSKHLQGQGCPKCKISHLENKTEIILNKYNIPYEYQKKFDWLISSKNRQMSLDFYLPNHNVAIECQGVQHYKATGIFTNNMVNEIQHRDYLKKRLCEKHDIQIIFIKYTEDKEKTIIEKINKIIKIKNG